MIREILNDKIAEQRQEEREKQEKMQKQAEEMQSALSVAEKEIVKQIENAPLTIFSVPENCNPIIAIVELETKVNYEKNYKVLSGYEDENSSITIKGEISTFAITLTYLYSKANFDNFFAEDNPKIIKGFLSADNVFVADSSNASNSLENSLATTVFVF